MPEDQRYRTAMEDLATLLANSTPSRLLIVAGVTTLAFALSAFA
jgi:putative NADH-flavin reductase